MRQKLRLVHVSILVKFWVISMETAHNYKHLCYVEQETIQKEQLMAQEKILR